MKVCLAALLLVLTACGRPPGVDDGLRAYVDSFEKEGARVSGHSVNTQDVSVTFEDLDDSTLGRCDINDDGSNPHVLINRSEWSKLSPSDKEKVVFHELGHCVLKRAHDNTKILDGSRSYKSIMISTTKLLVDYSVHRDAYLVELFTNK